MSAGLSLTQSQALTDLRSLLLNFLDPAVEVVLAQDNRVPEPTAANFVLMTPVRRDRIATNIDTYQDCAFVGVINGTVMTVSGMILGKILIGATVFGQYVSANTKILAQTGGTPGGAGSYTIAPSQVTPSGAIGQYVIGQSPMGITVDGVIMASGGASLMQQTKFIVQLDVHGPASADNGQIISTIFRDPAAYDFLQTLGHDVSPLYADDPRQMPYLNEQQQIEWRWVIEAALQINPLVLIPQQYADTVTIILINVDEHYPPT